MNRVQLQPMWILVIAVGLSTVVVLAVFGPGLQAGFVSDAWIFLHRAQLPSAALLDHVWPSSEGFYRPIVELAFWFEYRTFGLNPLPYHLLQLAGHAAASVLVTLMVFHMTTSRLAAGAAGAAFFLSMHAHEVVFDIADVHNAIGAPLLFGAVYAAARNRTILPAVLTAALFLVDESALLVVPLALVYLVFGSSAGRTAFLRLLPTAAIVLAYLSLRMATGGFGTEVSDHCVSVECIASGMRQYFNRLFLRPDQLISTGASTAAILAALGFVVLMLRPWAWKHVRPAIFGTAWAAGTSLFFVLALWPYIADRFLYIPSAGVAMVIGVAVAEAVCLLRAEGRGRAAAAVSLATVVLWVGLGAVSLSTRAAAWTAAGERARFIVDQIVALHPDPPKDATLSFRGVPHSLPPVFPPGNTGPYVFHNGLPQALAMAYQRVDLQVVEDLPAQPNEREIIRLAIYASGVVAPDPGR